MLCVTELLSDFANSLISVDLGGARDQADLAVTIFDLRAAWADVTTSFRLERALTRRSFIIWMESPLGSRAFLIPYSCLNQCLESFTNQYGRPPDWVALLEGSKASESTTIELAEGDNYDKANLFDESPRQLSKPIDTTPVVSGAAIFGYAAVI